MEDEDRLPREAGQVHKRAGGLNRPTLHDVARLCGVTAATVSNVINNRAGFVGEKTRKRVLKEIERVGYRPQAMARGLRMSRRHSLAMVIVDESENYLDDTFFAKLTAGFSAASDSRGYTTLIHGTCLHKFNQSMAVSQLQVDGYCIASSGEISARMTLIKQLGQLDQPVVLIQESSELAPPEFGLVRQDDFGGGRQLADHLLARGAKRFVALVPELSCHAFEARLQGVRTGLSDAGSDAEIVIVKCLDETFDHAREAMDAYFQANGTPDVVLGLNDRVAFAALQSARAHGLDVPKDLMVTGFNDFEPRKYASPLLTTISSPARDIGIAAALKLIDRVEQGHFETSQTVLPVQFALGDST